MKININSQNNQDNKQNITTSQVKTNLLINQLKTSKKARKKKKKK